MMSVLLLCGLLSACTPLSGTRNTETAEEGPPLATESTAPTAAQDTEPVLVREEDTAETESDAKDMTEVVIRSADETEPLTAHDPQTGGVVHTVRAGETLSRIAALYHVRVDDLAGWNRILDPDRLPAGSKLVIREPGSGPTPEGASEAAPVPSAGSMDNTAYGWSYPAGEDVESLVNSYGAYSRIPQADRQLVLTFDLGYSYKDYAVRILDTLRDRDVSATFFITGAFLNQEPQTLLRMGKEGHLVGNHTMMHLNPPQTLAGDAPEALTNDVVSLEAAYKSATGAELAKYLRPPEGSWSVRSLSLYRDLGYTTLFWDLTYRDWEVDNQLPENEALALLKEQTRDGAVILLHGISETNTIILGDYIDWAREQGYTFVRPDAVFPE